MVTLYIERPQCHAQGCIRWPTGNVEVPCSFVWSTIPPEGQEQVHPSSLGSSAGRLSSSTLPHWRTLNESAWQRQGVCDVSKVQRLCMFCCDTVCSFDNIKVYVVVCISMYVMFYRYTVQECIKVTNLVPTVYYRHQFAMMTVATLEAWTSRVNLPHWKHSEQFSCCTRTSINPQN